MVRRPRKIGGVGAARVGDDDAAQIAQRPEQRVLLTLGANAGDRRRNHTLSIAGLYRGPSLSAAVHFDQARSGSSARTYRYSRFRGRHRDGRSWFGCTQDTSDDGPHRHGHAAGGRLRWDAKENEGIRPGAGIYRSPPARRGIWCSTEWPGSELSLPKAPPGKPGRPSRSQPPPERHPRSRPERFPLAARPYSPDRRPAIRASGLLQREIFLPVAVFRSLGNQAGRGHLIALLAVHQTHALR